MTDWTALAAKYPERFVWQDGVPVLPVIAGGTGAEPAVIAMIAVAVLAAGLGAYQASEAQAAANANARAQRAQQEAAQQQQLARERAAFDQATLQQQYDRQAAEREAQAHDYNAAVAQKNATLAREVAATDAEHAAELRRRMIGANTARYAASGVTVSEGSSLISLMDEHDQASLEVRTILRGGEMRAHSFEDTAALEGIYATSLRDRRQAPPTLLAPTYLGNTLLTGSPGTAALGSFAGVAGSYAASYLSRKYGTAPSPTTPANYGTIDPTTAGAGLPY